MVRLIDILVFIVVGFPLTYLAFLSLVALLGRRSPPKPVPQRRWFAVVVPAHNEEAVVKDTIASLQMLEYPRSLFEIVVVADNCSDRTAEVARAAGVRVLERTSADQRSKGHALRWAFDRLLPQGFDAVVVCDADTIATANLLETVNALMAKGADVVQCADLVRPNMASWSAEATRAGFLLYNIARPLGRSVLGLSAGLRGNGMAFRAETLRQVPWEAFSRAEDLEYGIQLLLQGFPVWFTADAGVYATMPAEAANAETQRARWEGGRFPIIRRYSVPLLRESVRRRSFVLLDTWIDLMTPALVNLVGIASIAWLLSVVFAVMGVNGPSLLVWSLVLCMVPVHVIGGFAAARALPDLWILMRHVPRYAVWKAALYLRLAVKGGQAGWIRTTREISPSERTP